MLMLTVRQDAVRCREQYRVCRAHRVRRGHVHRGRMRDDVRQSVFYVLGLPFWQVRVGRVQRAVRHAVQQLHKIVSLWAIPVLCVHYELQYGLPSLLGVSCGRIYFNCLHCYV